MSIDFHGLEQREQHPTHGDQARAAIIRCREEMDAVLEAYFQAGVDTQQLRRLMAVIGRVEATLTALETLTQPDQTVVLHEVEARLSWDDFWADER